VVGYQRSGQHRQWQLATAALAGFASFIVVLVAFHFIQPELNPIRRFGSEYAVGRMGWLMKTAFFCFSAGLAALATAIGFTAGVSSRSRIAGVLLWISSVGILLSGVFNSDLQGAPVTGVGVAHDLAGFAAFLTVLPAMFVVSRRLPVEDVGSGTYSTMKVLPLTSLILFLALLFYFGMNGLGGLGQRIFLASLFSWLLVTAQGVRSGVMFRAE